MNREAYFLRRPLLLYTDTDLVSENPQISDFLNFFLTYVDEEIDQLGYFSLTEETLSTTKQALLQLLNEGVDEDILE